MNSPQTLIFDLDGTLIDSSAGVADAVNYSLERAGYPLRSVSEIAPFIGFPLCQMYQEFGVGPYDELYSYFQERAATSVIAAAEPLPGADEVVKHLFEQGHTMSIATTKVRRHVEEIVSKLQWTDYFPALVGGDDVARPKPDPAAFALALHRLGSDPASTIVVGDTINDIYAAQALSLHVIAVRSPYGRNDQLAAARPDDVIDSIALLPALLREMRARKEAI